MKSTRFLLIVLFLIAYAIPAGAEAGKVSWNTADISSAALYELDAVIQAANKSAAAKKIPTFKLTLTPGGFTEIRFTEIKRKDWTSYIEKEDGSLIPDDHQLYLLKGTMRHAKRGPRTARFAVTKAAATVSLQRNNRKQLIITFLLPDLFGTRMYQIESNGRGGKAKVRSAPLRAMKGKNCGLEALAGKASSFDALEKASTSLKTSPATTVREIEFATDCDYECYSRLGTNANDKIAGYVNIINTIYESQLGLTLKLVNQRVRTNTSTYPTNVTSADDLLPLFQTHASELGPADDKVLLTGKNLDGNTVGLGYSACQQGIAGVVCVCSSYATAIVQSITDLFTPIILAHEIGHNLGGQHDTNPEVSKQGIMGAVLDGSNPPHTFSSFSLGEIGYFVSHYGSCLRETSVSSSSSSSSSSSNSGNSGSISSSSSSTNSSSSTGSSSSNPSSNSSSSSSSSAPNAGGDNPGAPVAGGTLATQYRRNSFAANVTLPAGVAQCTVTLLGSSKQGSVFSRPYIIASRDSAGPVSFAAANVPFVTQGRTPVKAYFGARLLCSGTVYRTGVKRLTVSSSARTRARKLSSTNAWLKALKARVKAA